MTGEKDILNKEFAPSGGKPISVLEMVAREFMPGGLLLPWDNYGYQFGVRSALAYGALKTKDRLFFDTLENKCIWTYDIGIGWAYDDLVWTLIWWPDSKPKNDDDGTCWFEKSTGVALVSKDKTQYAIQMWDESAPIIPTRCHVNPNAVLFSAYGVPLSADGSPTPNKNHSFMFDDTWRSVGFLSMNTESRYNYGDGCLGAHSCVILDNNEGMRANSEYNQICRSEYFKEENSAFCDVTPIYVDNHPDIKAVVRKTTLACDRFYLVEDLVCADDEHKYTSRFLLRPNVEVKDGYIKLSTKEKVSLYIKELIGIGDISLREIENHPFKPDGHSQAVDFSKSGIGLRNLFVAFASTKVSLDTEITELSAFGDKTGGIEKEQALIELKNSQERLSLRLPAYMLSDLPNYKTWWYSATIQKGKGKKLLRLPVGMWNTRIWFDDIEVDLSDFELSKELVAPIINLPADKSDVNFLMRVEVPISHYDGGGDGTVGMTGGLWLCDEIEEENVISAKYENNKITLITNKNEYEFDYQLLREEDFAKKEALADAE